MDQISPLRTTHGTRMPVKATLMMSVLQLMTVTDLSRDCHLIVFNSIAQPTIEAPRISVLRGVAHALRIRRSIHPRCRSLFEWTSRNTLAH